LCYMPLKRRAATASVGVRELRQNLSVYLAKVATGTVFRVTDRGKVVALLMPLPAAATTIDRLVASGRATAARKDLAALGVPTTRSSRSLSVALGDVRDDRL
jgi:prevent-host-death family protein